MNRNTKVWIIDNGSRNITNGDWSDWSDCLKTREGAIRVLLYYYCEGNVDATTAEIDAVKNSGEFCNAYGRTIFVRESTAGRCGYDGRRKVAYVDTGIGYRFSK